MHGIMAGLNQKDRYVARCRAHCCTGLVLLVCSSRSDPFYFRLAHYACIMTGMDQKDSYAVGWFHW